MNDDTREKRWQDRFPRLLPRYALLACLALVVVSLGVVLTPARPRESAEPSFSDQARGAALAETVRLLDAGSHLGTPAREGSAAPSAVRSTDLPEGKPADTGNRAVERAVTLLTTQAQALLAPGQSLPDAPGASRADSGEPSASASASAGAASAAAASAAGSSAAASSAAPLPATAGQLVTALADSGRQRLADAAVADGGMARLLAAVGTAQLLEASALAAGTGTAAPPADVAFPQLSGACPTASTGSGAATTGTAPRAAADSPQPPDSPGIPGASPAPGATVETALAAVARTEAQTIYGYQVALPRLDGDAAKSAAEQLARHGELLSSAESLSRQHCSAVPPREAGYALGPSFLASPAAGLGSLETAALPVYGDLVALSDGETRQWAIAALLDSGKRAVVWGTDPGALPGLDRAALPSLPAN
ncbi:ferritin-like domain-containing protein [Arthrobacter sp. NicSoilB8]|uniref:ferritin-like domain-containing protein n=1 Tax=Arthrobacter sp. NicSoilB8 TaxID=2830998 RepID=UPI001CC75D45|nr:ferritin-like domain-containing protein [Arthrobacter sp. NicSoilB8]BCW70364.1 hypothetical protein NicSoilB8_14080 [Arthrobacter sp. NicSoilB8]